MIAKNGASTVSATAKASDSSSARIKWSKTNNINESNHLKDGELKVQPNTKTSGGSLTSKESTTTMEISSKYDSGNGQLEGQVLGTSGRRNRGAESTSSVEEIRPQSHERGIRNSSLRSKSQAPYEPEKWMLPEKGGSDLNQLNLAIVSQSTLFRFLSFNL